MLQLLLTAFQLPGMLLLLLQPSYVLHRGLEDGAFVPPHVAAERRNVKDNLLHRTPLCRQNILCNKKKMQGKVLTEVFFLPLFYDMNKKW